MGAVKMTWKRQVTFPRDVCRKFGLAPGDRLIVRDAKVDGEQVVLLKKESPARTDPGPSVFGSLKKYAVGKSHSMADIRKSIAKGMRRRFEA